MTNEEAIRILDPEMRWETMRKIPVMERIEADQEACRLAVAALRAQETTAKLDRSQWDGCPNCHRWQTYGYRNYEPTYCRDCGKPLNEEAWAELERRINGG